MAEPVYTSEKLERWTHRLLTALGIDGFVFLGANAFDALAPGDAFLGLRMGLWLLSVVAAFVICLLLVLNLIARALLSNR
jgi:hypothetical protein